MAVHLEYQQVSFDELSKLTPRPEDMSKEPRMSTVALSTGGMYSVASVNASSVEEAGQGCSTANLHNEVGIDTTARNNCSFEQTHSGQQKKV